MRFTDFWAELLSQNQALKWGLFSTSVLSMVLTVCLASVASKDPLLIERECVSQVLTPVSVSPTNEEIEQFVRLVLPKRLDTQTQDAKVYLSEQEFSTRQRELEDFSKKQVSQRILVSSVKVGSKNIDVEADRILAVGKVRSILPLRLQLVVRTIERSPSNPYGLILANTTVVNSEEVQK